MTLWSPEQVAGLAPDAAGLTAAQKLATTGAWPSSGASRRAVWGESAGSGKRPYRVAVDLDGPAFSCSCPSRKIPCKHALGLLLRWAAGVVLVDAEQPGWLAEWLAERDERAAATAARVAARAEAAARRAAGGADGPGAAGAATGAGVGGLAGVAGGAAAGGAGVGGLDGVAGGAAAGGADGAATGGAGAADPTELAREQRVAARAQRISAGVADLDRWLADLVRDGLAAAQARPYVAWDQAAARLVDAQAPGLAGQVRRLGAAAHSGPGWPARLLEGAGRLHLAVRAWEVGEALDAGTRADVRSVVGWPVDQDEVRAGEGVADCWVVVGQQLEEDERLRTRRTWLAGARTGRRALLLAFTAAGQAFAGEHVVGSALEGELAFFPGAVPLRALLRGEAAVVADGLGDGLPGVGSVAALLAAWADVLAANPWHGPWLGLLAAVVPVRTREGWVLRDGAGDGVRLGGERAWELAALAGGAPVAVAGVWSGRRLTPLLALGPDGAVVLG